MGGTGNANGGGGGVGGGMGGGLNSAGNRASGAGPGASGNRSTSTNNGGLNSAGNRASGAGPMSSSNRATTGGGYGTPSGGMTPGQDKTRQGDLASQARASENQSMKDLARENALGTIGKAEAGIKDPYNTLSGGVIGNVTGMTVREAIDFAKTAWTGKLANVVGAFQMKDTTLAALAGKMGLMDAKMTPQVQDRLAVGLMQERANRATVNGQIDVDKFAQELSREWASVADPTTGVSHYAKNGIDKASVSAATAREIAKDLVANGVVSAGKSVGSITSKDVSSYATQTPGVSSFSSKYMGGTPAASGLPDRAPTPSGRQAQQNDPSGLPAGTYNGYDPSGLPADKPASVTPNTRPNARPDPVSVVSGKPAASPPTGQFPDRPRSLGEKIAAGVIDGGLGALPGIGMAAGIINGGLALTGNRTLGEHLVDSFATGKGAGTGPDSGANRGGSSGKDQPIKDKSTVPEKEDSFEDKYMKFIDPTVRPTPAQKWDYNTPGYA
ncbi:hypothetical protein NKJ71_19360 [Mesorhizobium sp. M0050]|uniref:hypothetical protein n=1 Tax=Mesorhizobium sp. M0050 TaxID=2956861 RepID=UPI003335E08D